jgi:hypothetical protein
MNSAEFRQAQARRITTDFRFAPGEELLRAQFEQLAVDTYDALRGTKEVLLPFTLDDDFSKAGAILPRPLLDRWKQWQETHRRMLERNPILALYSMMHDIGETVQYQSWPQDREDVIQDWLDADEYQPPPFPDVLEILTPDFWARMREFRRRAGGWLYWNEKDREVVFVPENKWQRLRRR